MPVDPKQVQAVFLAAIGCAEPSDRAAVLERACRDDAELRGQVEALLKAHGDGSGLLPTIDRPTPADSSTFFPVGEGPGTTIGRYKLLQQIGEGGFGTVFLAEQEQPVRRKVALKIIKPGMDTRQVIARFEGERQALAIMDHPNIAKVLDGGATETGRPYFVMELVRGVPITDYCDTNNLTVAERLELFVQVCQAVQHAHQKGIIHRDIKPSNVMVMMADGQPTPKVIDFGIAKATDQRLTEKTIFTEFRQMVGTLEYMSPEQAEMAGIDIDTRSDIYSLGVLLYELLVGSTPFDPKELRSKAYAEMQRIIREVEPPRPSTKLSNSGDSLPSIAAHRRIDPAKLGQILHGELDWIVMRALEKDRTRRYATANGLAKDVRRYLADEPVEACPPSTAYRLQKLLRKYRRQVLAGGLMLLAVLIGAGVSAWQAVRATLAESRAVSERDEKEAARALLVTQKQLAERLASEKSKLAESARAQAIELRHRLTQNLFDLGWSQFAQGNLPQAMAILAGAYDKAAEADPLRASIATVMGAWKDRAPIYLPHRAAVVAISFSPDGSTVLTGSYDKTARLWDARTGKPLGEPLQHAAFVRAVAYSPDGSTVLTGCQDGKAQLWDARTGKPRGEPLQHNGSILAVAYSPDGSELLTGSADGTARLWDARTSAPRGVPMTHDGEVRTVAYSPDGSTVLTGSTDWSARLWDARTQLSLGKRMKHYGWVSAAVFSPDGSKVLTGSYDRTARLWDAKSGESLAEPMKQNNWVIAAVFSPDGSTLLTGSQDGVAQLWDAGTAKPLGEPLRHDGPVRAVAYSPDGSIVLTGSLDATARLWDARTGQSLGEPTKHNGGVVAVAFSPDGSRFLTGSNDPAALLCDIRTRKPLAISMRHNGRAFLCVAYSPDGSTVLTGGADSTARLWNARTGKPLVEPMRHPKTVNAVAYSPDGSLVLTGCVDGMARLWDTRTGKPVGEPMDHNGRIIRAVAYSPDGSSVLTGGEDNSARLWDTRTGKPVGAPMKHGGPINAVVYSPDGSTVLTGSDDKTARLWDAHTGKPLTEAMKNSGKVMMAVAFSPDGSRVVTASMDGSACLWDARTGKPLGERMKHEGPAWAAAYSPDGSTVVTGSQDRTARLWDGRTGKSVGEPMNHGGYVDAVAFSPDGTIVLTASEDRTARLWDARTGKPLGPAMETGGPILRSAYSPDGSTVLTGSEDGVARLWFVPRPISGRLVLLSAAAASCMRLDDTGHLERLTDAQLIGLWRQVDTVGSDWLADQARVDERKSFLWHRNRAAEAESSRNWFAAEFHLKWLSTNEPTDAEFIARLERVHLEIAKQGALSAAATSDKPDAPRTWHRKDGTSAEMKLVMTDGDEARFILPSSGEYRLKMDQLSDEDQTWIRNHRVEIEKRTLNNGVRDATRAVDAVPLRFVGWHYDADERGIAGYFKKRDSGWVEMKNNKTSPHATFEEIARTTEHVELFDVGRHMWIRLQPREAYFSQDGIKWDHLCEGVPDKESDSPTIQK